MTLLPIHCDGKSWSDIGRVLVLNDLLLIQPNGKSCSDLSRVLVFNDPADGPYAVTVTITSPGFSQVVNGSFADPGAYTLVADIPNWRARGHVTIRISDQSKLYAEDSYGVSFHMRFYRVLKWILVVPFMLMTTALIQMTQEAGPHTRPPVSSS